jgi:uncharacterized protein (TIGR03118 family)
MSRFGASVLAQGLSSASVCLLSIATALPAQQAPTQHYKQTNLVDDTTDPNLVNAWGISRSSTSPFWVSDNGTGRTTLYNGAGTPFPVPPANRLVVTIPTGDPNASPAGTPTGQIFNGTAGFQLKNGKPAVFLFVTEDGTLQAWNGTSPAEIEVNTKSASVFKGMAIASIIDPDFGPAYYLYLADFRKGEIAVYDSSFNWVPQRRHAFEDERIPKGFAPFNIQNIGGNLFVAFAEQDNDKHDEVDGAGLGFVDVFSPTGRLLLRLQHGSWFDGPWGMAMAPSDFGEFSHNILVGQFGSGQILAFDPITGRFKGRLFDTSNSPLTIDGLWGLEFGSGAPNSGTATTLFFAAGPGGEQHGLFGTITAVENVLGGDH